MQFYMTKLKYVLLKKLFVQKNLQVKKKGVR